MSIDREQRYTDAAAPSTPRVASASGAADGSLLNEAPPASALKRRTWLSFLLRTQFGRRLLIRIAVIAVLSGVLVMFGCDRLFYYPFRDLTTLPDDLGLAYEDVYFETPDGQTLHGWWLPATHYPARGTIVHFHGNAGNVSGHLPQVAWLPLRGYNVLLWDYRGYGRSTGKIHRAGTAIDAHAAVDYVLSRPDVDTRKLVAFGQSLGGAVAAVVSAERDEIRALVLETTFGDYREIAAHHLQSILIWEGLSSAVTALLISDGYDPIDTIDRIAPRPLLILTAGKDQTCPPELGKRLFAAAGDVGKRHVHFPTARHMELQFAGSTEYFDAILATFDAALGGSRTEDQSTRGASESGVEAEVGTELGADVDFDMIDAPSPDEHATDSRDASESPDTANDAAVEGRAEAAKLTD